MSIPILVNKHAIFANVNFMTSHGGNMYVKTLNLNILFLEVLYLKLYIYIYIYLYIYYETILREHLVSTNLQ